MAGIDPADPAVWLARWNLEADGAPLKTRSSLLLPVRRVGMPAMLKIAHEQEERRGSRLMAWWNGDGAARVLAEEEGVLLLERAGGSRLLAAMARAGDDSDEEATRILCVATRRLHDHRAPPPSGLVPLGTWFEPLLRVSDRGDLIAEARTVACDLLAGQRDPAVLHGDIHHENVLDAGPRGWIVIDPKGLLGERTFDYVNLLRNPDDEIAMRPDRFTRQIDVIVEMASLDRTRLLQWTLAFAGLSAIWMLNDGATPKLDLAIAELTNAALSASR